MICLLAVLALDKPVNYTSVYEYVTPGCGSGGVCCGSTSTVLQSNNTLYTAYHLEAPRTYRQVLGRASC